MCVYGFSGWLLPGTVSLQAGFAETGQDYRNSAVAARTIITICLLVSCTTAALVDSFSRDTQMNNVSQSVSQSCCTKHQSLPSFLSPTASLPFAKR